MSGDISQEASSSCAQDKSFFRSMPHKFDQVELTEHEEIATQPFLLACGSIVPIFDLLGPTMFSPVKSDIEGNINKLQAKYKLDPTKYSTLQQMALQELREPEACERSDAIESLLWLKRALEFIYEFLQEYLNGNPSLSDCAHAAYSKTLKPFHGFLVRGIFALVVRAVPCRAAFTELLIPLEEGKTLDDQEVQIRQDSQENLDALRNIIRILNSFYQQHNIDSDKVV